MLQQLKSQFNNVSVEMNDDLLIFGENVNILEKSVKKVLGLFEEKCEKCLGLFEKNWKTYQT